MGHRYGRRVKSKLSSAAGVGTSEGPGAEPLEPLIAVRSWPGAVRSYRIDGTEQAPSLSVTVSNPAQRGPSGPSGPFEPSEPPDPSGTAADQAARYRLICSQLDQPGLTVALLSTLNPGLAMPVADGASSLRRHAAAAELLASTTATVTPPDLTGVDTLAELMDSYGVPAQILAAANADRPLNSLLAAGQPLAGVAGPTEPDSPSSDTLASITVPADPSSLAEVAGLLGVTPQRLLEDNRGLRLATEASWVLPGVVELPADAALSRPLAVLAGDVPLTAAEVGAQHDCPSEAFAALNAAVLGVLEPGVEVSAGATTVTTTRHDTLKAVLSRFAVAGVRHTVSELLAANASTPLFRAGARVLLPAPPVTLTASGQLVGTFTAPAFELAVTLRLERPAAVEPEPAVQESASGAEPEPTPAPAPAPVEQVDSAVPAAIQDRVSFDAFIDACLTAVPGIRLATARQAAAGQAGESDALWAVAFGSQGITSVRLQPPAGYAGPRFLAPRLLYTAPLHFQAWVSELTDLGALGRPIEKAFHDVDAERWARHFLTDLDRYLDAPFATLLTDQAPEALLRARHDLAEAIVTDVAAVLAPDPTPDPTPTPAPTPTPEPTPDPTPTPASTPTPAAAGEADGSAEAAWLAPARAALAAECRNSLAGGYGSVAVQHSVAAVTEFGKGRTPAARLGGVVRTNGVAQPSTTELNQLGGWSVFAVETRQQDTSQHGDTSVTVDCDQAFDSLTIDAGAADGGQVELSFVRPLAGGYLPKDVSADLGAIELPLAQRLRPDLPTLIAVTAQPSWTGSDQPTLSQAADWTLAVSYSHEHAAHDEVLLTIWHGLPAAARSAAATPAASSSSTALAGALAGYVVVAEQLAELLSWNTKPPKGRDTATARQVRENATATLVRLVSAVTEAWIGHTGRPPASGVSSADPSRMARGSEVCHEYRLRACYGWNAEGERQLERLVVTMTRVTAVRVAAGQPGGDWPVISCEGDDQQEAWTPGPVLDGQRTYTPARPIAATQPLTLRLEWPGLNVANHSTARAGITVSRNAVLRPGARTSPDFVLALPSHTSDRVSPANTWTQDITLSGASVEQALQACFDTLYGPQPPFDLRSPNENGRVTVGVQYSYLLSSPGPDGPGLRTELSVAYAEALVDPELAGMLTRVIEDWRGKVKPPADGAEWHFGLTLLSPRDGEPPLLTLDRLVFAIPAAAESASAE